MYSSKIIPVFVLISLILSFPAAAVEDSATPQIAGKPANAPYPFIATVTGHNVYVRSGKGTAYYACGKVNMNDQVTVIGGAFGWAEIVPPEGSYSWIHKNYVDVKQTDTPTVGTLNADNVRVWAGSDNIEPMRSSSTQTKLNTGEIVELFADQPQDCDYYKIKPPAGAKLTINCEFLKYVGPVASERRVMTPPQGTTTEKPADIPPSTETEAPTFKNLDKDKAPAEPRTEPAVGTEPSVPAGVETENLKACYVLAEKMDEERKKPLAEQNYEPIRKKLETIKADTTDSKAGTNAQILLERIARYELVISVDKTVQQQDESLAEAREKIEKARQAELKNVHREADYIYIGVLKVSHVYTKKTGHKRYLLQGPDGKILCYAIGASEDVCGQLEGLIGKRVGVKGDVSGDTKSLVTLISATAVEPM